MPKARHFEAERTRPQSVVAVFDDWDALHAVLVGLKSHTTLRSGVVLHARKDAPPAASSFGLLKEMAHLRFSQPRQDIACTAGPLAQELSGEAGADAADAGDDVGGGLVGVGGRA